jgi:hypothetical protein
METTLNQICPLCGASAIYEYPLYDGKLKKLVCVNCPTLWFDINLESIIQENKDAILNNLANINESEVFIYTNENGDIKLQEINKTIWAFFNALDKF